ncbi:hypothetical protein X801_06239, partial [Opisthorchis viverrini]
MSLLTIKKFVTPTTKPDVEELGRHNCHGIVHTVEKDVLARVGYKGGGASENFKVAELKAVVTKPKVPKKPKTL